MTTVYIFTGVCVVLAAAAIVIVFVSRRGGGESAQPIMLMQQQLTGLQDQLRQTMEANAARLGEYFKAHAEQWHKTHQTVGERLDGVSRTMGDRLDNAAKMVAGLDTRMVKIEEATKRVMDVGRDIASLQQILRAPKMRGNMGEAFLGDLLAQMLPKDAYELQFTFQNGERVDAIIKTAHGIVPVDAKFPLENFQRMASATNDEERRPWRKQFVADVKRHVDAISSKYIRPGEGTFEFALMYVPAENVYYEIIARDDDAGESGPIAAYAMKKRVVPVSPNTFYAYLNTILVGLKGMRIERDVQEIIRELSRLRTEFGRFQDDFAKLGKHLSDASSSFAKADKRLTRFDDRLKTLDRTTSDEVPAAEVPAELPPGSGLKI